MSSMGHLAKRFFGSWAAGPDTAGVQWAHHWMLDEEAELWDQMSGPDRRHSLGVARDVDATLEEPSPRPVIAAALLHDVGKIDARLGTFGRVAATLCGVTFGRVIGYDWLKKGGLRTRIALYLRHDEIGGDRLELLGSDPLTVSWAREHHSRPDDWTIDDHFAEVLHDCDND
ncbi:MAG: hypothetical protein IH940_00620 [Acidobacteria bacterium]|nr:hypothetical protein [Acidobacteriota bacterium]